MTNSIDGLHDSERTTECRVRQSQPHHLLRIRCIMAPFRPSCCKNPNDRQPGGSGGCVKCDNVVSTPHSVAPFRQPSKASSSEGLLPPRMSNESAVLHARPSFPGCKARVAAGTASLAVCHTAPSNGRGTPFRPPAQQRKYPAPWMFMTQKVPSPLPLPSYSKHDTTTSIINSQSSKMGVQKETIREGSGAIPQNGQTVTIEYTGWLNDPNAPNKKGAQYVSPLLSPRIHCVCCS